MGNRNERIFSTLLEISAEESLLLKENDMPSCEELNRIYTPSVQMDKKIIQIISSNENSQKSKSFIKKIGTIISGF